MDWPRLWLTLLMVVIVLVVAGLAFLGWRNRGRRQSGFAPLPEAPAELGPELAEALPGVYVSTTNSGSWQDRIVVQAVGRRAKASARLYAAGVLIDRIAESPIWIPAASLTRISTAPGVAGKVMGLPDGILLITWNWGDTLVDTGFRADDPTTQADWIAVAATLLTPQSGATA